MNLEQIISYIERTWNHPDGRYDRVITDVPGCARFVLRHYYDTPVDRCIGYWFRKA